MKTTRLVTTLLGAGVFFWETAQALAPTVLFVLDGSGSMWGRVEGKPKIEIARTVMGDMLGKLPDDVRTGLMVYGHNRKDDCKDIEVVAPLGSERSVLVQKLGDINPKGKTPLTEAVHLAAAQFQQYEGSASVVVVSDGKETCEGDPCIAAREATAAGVNLRIHVIGFDVTPEEKAQLNCIAEEGKGKYFSASNTKQLVTALSEVQKEVVAPTPPPPPAADPNAGDEIIFEDHFEREELGEMWELKDPDPDRFALIDGTALSVATKPEANIAILRQPISDDFIAIVKVNMKIGGGNWVEFSYVSDDKNGMFIWVKGIGAPYPRRELYFRKMISGKNNDFQVGGINGGKLGKRNLGGLSKEPEPWYLQLEKSGRKYTARASIDGSEWTDIGTHTVLKMKDARLGFKAGSGGGIENEAAFDDFVVKHPK
jgi:hypothetical protein